MSSLKDTPWAQRVKRAKTTSDLAWVAGIIDGEGCILNENDPRTVES